MIFPKKKNDPPLLSPTQLIGKIGEDACARYLRRHGYRILSRNYHAEHCEIDLIAESLFTLAIVEVKARVMEPNAVSPYGTPATAVTKDKRRHVSRAAAIYLSTHKTHKHVRFDVMEVFLSSKSGDAPPKVTLIRHHKDAFRPR